MPCFEFSKVFQIPEFEPKVVMQCIWEGLLLIRTFTNTGCCWLMYSPNFACLLQWGWCASLKAHNYTSPNLTLQKAHTEINIGWDGNASRLMWGMVMKPGCTSRIITSKTTTTKKTPDPPVRAVRGVIYTNRIYHILLTCWIWIPVCLPLSCMFLPSSSTSTDVSRLTYHFTFHRSSPRRWLSDLPLFLLKFLKGELFELCC